MELPVRWKWKLNRLRERLKEFFAQKEEEAPRPKLCPACHTLVGATQSRCHECGVSMTFSLAAASQSLRRWMPQENPASYAILAVSAFLYTISLMGTAAHGHLQGFSGGGGIFSLLNIFPVDNQILGRLGASEPIWFIVAAHQPWRFVTAIFLHASLVHILFNMWALLDIGPVVEELYGSARYLFVYVVTGIAGFVLSSIYGSAVGGSCSIVGLLGVMLAVTAGRSGIAGSYRESIIRWIIYIAIFSFAPGVSLAGHLGGGLAGFALGKIMAPNPPLNPHARKIANLMGWGSAALVIASFAMMILTYGHQ